MTHVVTHDVCVSSIAVQILSDNTCMHSLERTVRVAHAQKPMNRQVLDNMVLFITMMKK